MLSSLYLLIHWFDVNITQYMIPSPGKCDCSRGKFKQKFFDIDFFNDDDDESISIWETRNFHRFPIYIDLPAGDYIMLLEFISQRFPKEASKIR